MATGGVGSCEGLTLPPDEPVESDGPEESRPGEPESSLFSAELNDAGAESDRTLLEVVLDVLAVLPPA